MVDCGLTYAVVVMNGGVELNPIMKSVIDYDPISFVALKLLVSAIIILLYPYKFVTTRFYGIAFFIFLAVVLWNLFGVFYV